jgi:PAS domain-containing protein
MTVDSAELERLEDLFENASVGFALTDPAGNLLRRNRAFGLLTGSAPRDAGGGPTPLAHYFARPDLPGWLIGMLTQNQPVTDEPAVLNGLDGRQRQVIVDATARTGSDGRLEAVRWVLRPQLDGATPSLDDGENDAVRWARAVSPASDLRVDLSSLSEPEAEARLRELEDFFQNVPAAIHLIGLRGIVLRANRLDLAVAGHSAHPESYLGHHVKPYYADQTVLEDLFGFWDKGNPIVNFRSRLVGASGADLGVVIFSNSRIVDGQFRNTRCVVFPDPDQSAPPTATRRFRWPAAPLFAGAAATPVQKG